MRFFFFLVLLAINIFAYRWSYQHGTGMEVSVSCELYKSKWTQEVELARKGLESAPANIRQFLFSLITEKEYNVENCQHIAAISADIILARAESAYQNDAGNFQSFEHYRAELIERMDSIQFFSLQGNLLSDLDYWEVSARGAFYLGAGPYRFENDFTRRFALSQSIIMLLLIVALLMPSGRNRRFHGLS